MRVRTGASIAAAIALVAGLSGCSLFAVHQTLHPYDASDGIGLTVGDVRIINALVFTEDGDDGNFSAAAVNTSDSDIDLTLQYVSDGDKVNVEVEIPAGETVTIGLDDQVFMPAIDTAPGSLLTIYFQYADRPGKQVDVPVLDASLAQYENLLPTAPPAPVPTVTATPGADPTQTPAP